MQNTSIEIAEIVATLLDKAKQNENCLDSEELEKYADIDSLDYEEIETQLEKNGVIIKFKEDADLSNIEEVKIEEYTDLMTEFRSNDLMRSYLREIGNVPLLSSEDEIKYGKIILENRIYKHRLEEIEKDDMNTISMEEYEDLLDKAEEYDKARDALINSNLRLVVSVAKKYIGMTGTMHILDLIQEGNMGLIMTINKWDYRKGYKFSTYATWWIRQAITRSLADQSRTIRIPVHIVEKKYQYMRAKKTLIQELGREPSTEEIATKLDMPLKKVIELERYGADLISLDATVNEDKDSTLEDITPDRDSMSPEEYTMKKKLSEEIRTALSRLPKREADIVILRFGLDDGQPRTLEEVSKIYGLTRERIRQIEAKALRRLKKPAFSGGLRDFISK